MCTIVIVSRLAKTGKFISEAGKLSDVLLKTTFCINNWSILFCSHSFYGALREKESLLMNTWRENACRKSVARRRGCKSRPENAQQTGHRCWGRIEMKYEDRILTDSSESEREHMRCFECRKSFFWIARGGWLLDWAIWVQQWVMNVGVLC